MKSDKTKRNAWKASCLAVLSALVMVGCASTSDKLIRSVEQGDLDSTDALVQQLETEEERNEVQEYFRTQPSEVVELIEGQYGEQIDRHLVYGNFQGARDTARNGLTVIPESQYLEGRLRDVNETENGFQSFVTEWTLKDVDIDAFDDFLAAYRQFERYKGYDRSIHEILDETERTFKNNAYSHLAESLTQKEPERFVEKFDLIFEVDEALLFGYEGCRDFIAYQDQPIPRGEVSEFSVSTLTDSFECYRNSVDKSNVGDGERSFNDVVVSFLELEVPNHMEGMSKSDIVTEDINSLEDLLPNVPEVFEDSYTNMLAEAHLVQAERFVGLDIASVLAIVHAHRAEIIEPRFEDEVDAIVSTAIRSVYYSSDYGADLVLNPGRDIDPDDYDFIYSMLYSSINLRTNDQFRWNVAPRGYQPSNRYVEIDSVRYFHPDIERLNQVSSSYHSHNEQVENSAKSRVGRRIDLARIQLNMAETRYDQAINYYNINPTNFNYNSAQSAYRNYETALNHHNSLVRQYNSMPDYVTQPVYNLYTFFEGEVRHGWEVGITLREPGEEERRIVGSSVESAYTRQGTHYADRNASQRRDVPHNLNLSDNTSFQLLSETMDELMGSMEDFIGNSLDLTYSAGMSELEKTLVKDILHPWGVRSDLLSSLSWVDTALDSLDLSRYEAEPLPHHIARPSDPSSLPTAEQVANLYSDSVVLILARSGSGSSSTGQSSGAIIRSDGLILTTAHGLPGNELTVVVGQGAGAVEYSATIVQINHQMDVALLQIDSNEREFPIIPLELSDQVSQGGVVFAIGNPSLNADVSARNAITQGLVAQNSTSKFGSERLVLDVSIASGSSGGPVISGDSGRLVGVVTSVANPEFGTGRSASGSFALAAPSVRLSEWLGLQY